MSANLDQIRFLISCLFKRGIWVCFVVLLSILASPGCARSQDEQDYGRINWIVLNDAHISFRCADSSALRAIIPHRNAKIYSENSACIIGCSQYIYAESTDVRLIRKDSIELCDKHRDCFAIRQSQIRKVMYSHGGDQELAIFIRDSTPQRRSFYENPNYTLKDVVLGAVTIGVVMGAIIYAVHNVHIDIPDLWAL